MGFPRDNECAWESWLVKSQNLKSEKLRPDTMPDPPTGGKPLFTHWVCGEYMVGSETKHPPWTHQVHFDYFLIIFTICPQFSHPNTHWVHVGYFYKVPTQIPTNHQVGYIQKVPTKNPVSKCWLNHEQNPWFLSQFTQRRTQQILCERTPQILSKMIL